MYANSKGSGQPAHLGSLISFYCLLPGQNITSSFHIYNSKRLADFEVTSYRLVCIIPGKKKTHDKVPVSKWFIHTHTQHINLLPAEEIRCVFDDI